MDRRAFGKLAAEVPATQWRTYLRWHALSATANLLPKAFGDEAFAFHTRYLKTGSMLPR